MGRVVYWTIMRAAIVIPSLWFLMYYFQFRYWWIVAFGAIYGIIIHPAIIQFRKFEADNKEIVQSTLCSSCKHFDKTAVLCLKYDEHPSLNFLPCEGVEWEPINNFDYEEKEYN